FGPKSPAASNDFGSSVLSVVADDGCAILDGSTFSAVGLVAVSLDVTGSTGTMLVGGATGAGTLLVDSTMGVAGATVGAGEGGSGRSYKGGSGASGPDGAGAGNPTAGPSG